MSRIYSAHSLTPLRPLMLLFVGFLALAGCKPDDVEDGEFIFDQAPAITVVNPANGLLLGKPGTTFQVTLQAADNEALKLIRVVNEVFTEQDVSTGPSFIQQDIPVSGRSVTQVLPVTVPNISAFYRIKYTVFIIDSKGASASTFFFVNVLPQDGPPPVYKVLSYTSDTIYNKLSSRQYAFDFSNRRNLPKAGGPVNVLDFDIEENSGTGRGLWTPAFGSPSNNQLGLDSVFVRTDASRFNYEEATYQTIFNAFFSDPMPTTSVSNLQVGEYIIVRLIRVPRPQFAVMKINRIFSDGGGLNVRDYVVFDYKVTTP